MAGEGSADNLPPHPTSLAILGRNPLAALWMACSPTPETLRHPPLCNDSRPLFGPACGGPQNLAGEESLSHIMGWIAAPGRSATLPSVVVGVVTPAAFTISARGAVVVFAREKLDRATARRVPRYGVALLGDLLFHWQSRFGHCRSGSRLRRIVRLCWRHSRRGRNGQSRCAGRLQGRASTGTDNAHGHDGRGLGD